LGVTLAALEDTLGSDEYDEFGFLHEEAAEWDIPFLAPPAVVRRSFPLQADLDLSYLQWGEGEPELVLLHGSGQNAHTWDVVLLALGCPAVSVDLPGHGRSSRRPDRDYGPWRNAEAVMPFVEAIAPRARCVVGTSLGGMTGLRLAATRPDLCRRVIVVDATPEGLSPASGMTPRQRGALQLIGGPPIYESFEEMTDAAVNLNPFDSVRQIERAVRHNAQRLEDGRWTWRFDGYGKFSNWTGLSRLWDDVNLVTVPTLLVRGAQSRFVRDEDVAEMRRRLPTLEVAVVDHANHAVQNQQPLVMADLIRHFAPADA
jgi:pimeloyl-ACP methyl ester carboxylesterase